MSPTPSHPSLGHPVPCLVIGPFHHPRDLLVSIKHLLPLDHTHTHTTFWSFSAFLVSWPDNLWELIPKTFIFHYPSMFVVLGPPRLAF